MKVNRTLSAIFNGAWAMQPEAAISYLPQVAGILRGDISVSHNQAREYEEALKEVNPLSVVNAVSVFRKDSRYSSFNDAPKGSVAQINISGPILKEGECGEPGSQLWKEWIKEADASPNISSILLRIDSPGGSVNGTASLADAILSTGKRVVAFIDEGMAASAAYWIASAADQIVLSQEHDEVGSIGVFVTIADYYSYFEKEGLKVRDIYADQSTDKNGLIAAALAGDDDPIKKEMLNPIAEKFISTVKENRAGQLNLSAGDPFTGKMYRAKEAIAIGLADRVASYEEVLQGLFTSDQNSNSNTMANKEWPGVAATLGVEQIESTEEGVFLNEEQMEALEARIAETATAAQLQAAEESRDNNMTALGEVTAAITDGYNALGEEKPEGSVEAVNGLVAIAQKYGAQTSTEATRTTTEKTAEEEGLEASEADKINAEIARKAGADQAIY